MTGSFSASTAPGDSHPLPGDPTMAHAPEEGHYIYGVIQGAVTLPLLPGAANVETLGAGTVQALVERVRLAEWEPQRLADPAEMVEKVRRHHEVLQEVLQHCTPMPVRLGIIVQQAADVERWLRQAQGTLEQVLNGLDGREEWGARLVVNEAALRSSLAGRDELPDVPEGTRYLLRKRRERAAAKRAAEAREAMVERVRGAVWLLAEARASLPCRGGCAMNEALLVPRASVPRLQERGAELNRQLAGRARLDLTGPWPAYSFTPSLAFDGLETALDR